MENCDPVPTEVVELVPASDCPECTPQSTACGCGIGDLKWSGALTDCMIAIGLAANMSYQQVITMLAAAICDSGTSGLDCSDISIDGDYDGIGYDGTEHQAVYSLAGAVFGADQYYIVIDGQQRSLGTPANITALNTAISNLGLGTSATSGTTTTVVGFHDYGNVGYLDNIFAPVVTDTEETGTLCDLLDGLDYTLSHLLDMPFGFDEGCFEAEDTIPEYLQSMTDQLCADLYDDEDYLFFRLEGNSNDKPITGDMFFNAGQAIRFYDVAYDVQPNVVSYPAATTNGYGLSIFGGHKASGDVTMPVAFFSPVREGRYKITDIVMVTSNLNFTANNLPYQAFIDKSSVTAVCLPDSATFPVGVTNVTVRLTATVFGANAPGVLVINPGGSDTIQGSASFNFAPDTVSWVEFILDSSNWRIAAKG